MFTAKIYNVMIGTPSDIKEEIDIAKEVIYNWNDLNAEREGVVLLPRHWTSSTYPKAGQRPQESINKQIVLRSDLLISIFGVRIGTPTGVEQSGSVEEIDEHLKAGKDVMVFFKNFGSLNDIDPEQFKKLREFQKTIRDSVLWVTYNTPDDFRKLLYDKLQLYLNDNWLHQNDEDIQNKEFDDEKLREADRAIVSAQNSISFNGFVQALDILMNALEGLLECHSKRRVKKTTELIVEFIFEILEKRTQEKKCRVYKGKRERYIAIIKKTEDERTSNIIEYLNNANVVDETYDEIDDLFKDVFGDKR